MRAAGARVALPGPFQSRVHLLRWCEFARILGAEGCPLEVVPGVQAHQAIVGELGAGHAAALAVAQRVEVEIYIDRICSIQEMGGCGFWGGGR